MKLGTRLLTTLVPTVATVMLIYGAWALQQREQTVLVEARRETHAYATALGLTLEDAFKDPDLRTVQDLINRISREPSIYAVQVYDASGQPLFVSDPLLGPSPAPTTQLTAVLATGEASSFDRQIEDRRVYSVLRPIRAEDGNVIGIFEIAQPLDFVEAEKARIRNRFVLNTLTLFAALSIVTLWLIRRSVAQPMSRLVAAAQTLGRGELSHRLPEPKGGGELAELAAELNRMAAGLESTRADLVRELDERIALERRLRQTEKMAAIGTWAAGLAHEIAAPLNVISGRAEMLLKRPGLDEDQTRQLRIIVQQIQRITAAVHSLLDFGRRRDPHLALTNLADVLDAVETVLEHELAQAGVAIEHHYPRPLWVMGDAELLHRLFANLFLNSLHAMESSRERRIAVRVHRDSRPTTPATTREGAITREAPVVVLEVVDTGPGVPASEQHRIFEPFFTTKARGTGLGLIVARSIAEEHGGSLSLSTSAGSGGAVFVVTLMAANRSEETRD